MNKKKNFSIVLDLEYKYFSLVIHGVDDRTVQINFPVRTGFFCNTVVRRSTSTIVRSVVHPHTVCCYCLGDTNTKWFIIVRLIGTCTFPRGFKITPCNETFFTLTVVWYVIQAATSSETSSGASPQTA